MYRTVEDGRGVFNGCVLRYDIGDKSCLYLQTGAKFRQMPGAIAKVIEALHKANITAISTLTADDKEFCTTLSNDAEGMKGTELKIDKQTYTFKEYRTGGATKFMVKSFGLHTRPQVVIDKFLTALAESRKADKKIPSQRSAFKVRQQGLEDRVQKRNSEQCPDLSQDREAEKEIGRRETQCASADVGSRSARSVLSIHK